MPIHGSLFQEYAETAGQDPFTLQNKKMLKIQMQYGPVNTKLGSMVAYQGDVRFQNTGSGGLNKMLKSKLTGEGVNMMVAEGTGELFVADLASEIQLFYLENDMVSVNGNNVLAFSSSIEWDIHRVNAGRASMMAGGMFNVSLRGTGYVAVTTKGDPVCLDVAGAPTYADAEAVVLWTGIAELAGAAGLIQPWSPALKRAAGIGLALYALCVWPANINHMIMDMARADGGFGLAYHIPRMVAQPVIIWLALWVSGTTDWPFRHR